MASDSPGQRAVVKYDGVEYELPSDLTERERFDAERLSGRSLDEIGTYTRVLLIAYFALRRAGISPAWDDFLDGGGFQLDTRPPLVDESQDEGALSETGGIPTSPPFSESTPGA